MEIDWLEDLICLAATRNFTRAAEQRHTTQPAFSRRIQSLEAWVGMALVDREVSPIALTPAGTAFVAVARDVVEHLERGKAQIRDDLLTADDLVVFAASHSLSASFFPPWIRALEGRLGVIRHRLISDRVGACLEALGDGRCHFLLCHTHAHFWPDLERSQVLHLKVGRDRLVPVCGRGADGEAMHPLSRDGAEGTGSAPPESGQRVPFLGYERSSSIGQAVDARVRSDASLACLERVFASPYASILASMARQGRGLAWLPESMVELELTTGVLVRAATRSYEIDVDISLFRPTRRLSRRAEVVWRDLTKAVD